MSLLDSLVSHWRLDEVSGVRADCHSINHLTDNNTVTQAVGKIGSAGQFTAANLESLSIVDNAAISGGDIDFTFSVWVYIDSLPSSGNNRFIFAQFAGGDQRYILTLSNTAGTSRFVWAVYDGASTIIGSATATALGTPSTATWYHIVVWHDAAANVVGIRVNDTSENTAATTGAAGDSDAVFALSTAGATTTWDGRLDSLSYWKRLLTSTEKTLLYNGGSGRDYPFPTGIARLVGRGLAA